MRFVFLILVLCAIFGFSAPLQTETGWKRLVPLHSTRADVERLLGPSSSECRCLYDTADARIQIDYAVDRCKGVIPGWNVPADTVLRLTVRPTVQQRFSDLGVNTTKYTVRRDDTFATYYANRDDGVQYSVSAQGVIDSISYIPSTADANLRCSGFPLPDGSVQNHLTFDVYGDLEFNNEAARLDPFAIRLDQQPKLKGYVIVYAGRLSCAGEARLRADRAKKYLVKKRGLSDTRIVAIDGGYRETFAVELYALPEDAGPPDAISTISANEVRHLRTGKCSSLKDPVN